MSPLQYSNSRKAARTLPVLALLTSMLDDSFFLSQLQSSHGQLLPSKRRDASKTAASSLVYHPPHPFPPRDLATLAIRE